nr:hypothetical protein GZ27B6_3 [uncultured archaeon GZfos27B6]
MSALICVYDLFFIFSCLLLLLTDPDSPQDDTARIFSSFRVTHRTGSVRKF